MAWQFFSTGVLDLPKRFQLSKTAPARVARSKPSISIIIPAHNEASYLPETLKYLEAQSYDDFEVIVVPNGCSDDTAQIASNAGHEVVHMRERGLSRARNLGAQNAHGDLLVFLDADTLLPSDALEAIAEEFTRDFSAGTLKGRPDRNRLNYKLMYLWKNTMHFTGLHKGSSGVILCWKDYFDATGGFDEALHVCENSDLIRKLGKWGDYKYINQITVTTSMRRYEKTTRFKTIVQWTRIWLQGLFGSLRHKHYEPVR